MSTETGAKPTPKAGQTAEQADNLRRIATDQGTLHTSNVKHLWGAGKELWADDDEFDAFLASIRAIREQA
ncbi:MAG TPA: hypothetical protein VG097_03865 [Gemmata sp.]|jgi:hypothetical protein|nr:hypothetical protein [Gemmata sp.]